MQKLLIVEDEKSIFFLLNNCILYEELGLELVGYAENGQTAYDMIMEKHPDIVITDITMPVFDGLELIEKVQERYTDINFIIVSGYAQFEFAKKAVKLGVKDYLLKPINSNELNRSLAKLTQKLSEDGNEEFLLQNTDNHREKIRTSFIMSVLYRDIDFNRITINEINRNYFYTFREELFCAFIIKVDYYSNIVIGIKNHITDNLIMFVKEYFSGLCFDFAVAEHQENIYVILNFENREEKIEEIKRTCDRLLKNGKKLTEGYTNTGVSIGFGMITSKIQNLTDSFRIARHLLDMRIIRGVNQVLYADNEKEECERKKYVLPNDLLGSLSEKVERNALEDIKKEIFFIFQNALDFCKKEDISVYKIFRGVILNILSIIKQKGDFPDEFMDIYQELSLELNKCSRYYDLMNTLPERIMEEILKFQTDDQSEGSLIMKRVLGYVSENYDKPLKLEDVAEQVYISPAYLGIIFKKETGKNFTTYLTDLRMKKAKELLLDVRININEVTYKVGYNNVRYFSRIFKENVGISPKEYRKIHANRIY